MVADRAVLYRAMRAAERDATLAAGGPVFQHGHKFFSPDLGWVADRVRDGTFRGSGAQPGDYAHVLRYEFRRVDLALFRRLNGLELSLSARDARHLRAAVFEVGAGEVEAARLRRSHGAGGVSARRHRVGPGTPAFPP